jgi:predicted membrane protein
MYFQTYSMTIKRSIDMDPKPSIRITPQLISGFTIILVGVLFLLDNLGVVRAENFWQYWPVLLIVVGAAKLTETGGAWGKLLSGGLMGFGLLLLLDNLHVTHVDFWKYWPALLILAGMALVWQVFIGTSGKKPLESQIRGAAVLGGFKRSSRSQNFQGGELTSIMGGCEIDLREASIQAEQAVISCFAFWGGIEIKVPEDWNVSVDAVPILGGFDDKTRHPQEAFAKQLLIRGFVLMGGVEVRN